MISENPVFGIGFGRFAPEYMLAQADYFASGVASEEEKLLAGQVSFAYNEFLQLIVELGLVGLILFCQVLYSAFRMRSPRNRGHKILVWHATLVGFVVFACFSYPLYSWSIVILLVLVLGNISASNNQFWRRNKFRNIFVFTMIALWCFSIVWVISLVPSLERWQNARLVFEHFNYTKSMQLYISAFDRLVYEGAFLQELAKVQQQVGKFAASNSTLYWSQTYFNDPFTYSIMGENFTRLHKYVKAEESYNKSLQMVPNRIWPRFLLIKMLWAKGDRERCRDLAEELLKEDIWVDSKASQEILDKLLVFASIKNN